MKMQGHWQSDGTESDGKATWTVETHEAEAEHSSSLSSSSTIIVSTPGGSPMNLLCTTPSIPKERFFFKVHIVETDSRSFSLSVGVARPDEFKKGYRLKGMFYNGNLTNASAALKVSFGPHLKQGDTVVVEYVENEETMRLNIFLNGSPLGTGFEIPKTEISFVPCLSLQGDVTLKAEVLSEPPTIVPSVPAAPFGGKWNVAEIITPSAASAEDTPLLLWPIPGLDKKIVLNIEKEPSSGSDADTGDVWNFSARVANTFGIRKRVVKTEGNESTTLQNSHGGMVRSTQMMPPPLLKELERELPSIMSNHWAQLKNIQSSDSILEIQSENGTTITKCQRIEPSLTGAACTSYND